MVINFFPSKDSEETRTMYNKSDNIEVVMGNETDKIIEKFLILFDKDNKKIRRINEKKKIFFHCVDSLYYKLHKISLNRGGSNIDSLKWLKQKKATINQKNDDDKCFQYAITVALNREKIKSHPERTSNSKPLLIDMIGKK